MRLIVVSGLSGAGKGVAINALEDLGYLCVDNLPLRLLPALAEDVIAAAGDRDERVGAVIDVRSPGSGLSGFGDVVKKVEALGVSVEVLYLEAEEPILLKRFSETRRKHPLTGPEVSLAEAIRRERILLEPVRVRADIVVDTSRFHLHALRDLVRRRVEHHRSGELSLLLQSFGYKYGVPGDADMVFDARCLPNPHWEPDLRPLTGQSPDVRAFLESKPEVGRMLDDVAGFLEHWIPCFEADNRAYLTVAIGCTGGQHRSVYLVERLSERFRSRGNSLLVRHREL